MITWAKVCQLLDQLVLSHDVDRPVTDEETRRAEGTQHAHTPGEVSGASSPDPSPSPGDLAGMADSDLLKLAAEEVDGHAIRSISSITVADLNYLLNLADELRDRAAQFAALESLDSP